MTRYLIENGTLIDCTGAPAQPGQSLLVEDSRIVKIGPVEAVSAAAGAGGRFKRIDAAGCTIMPGMIDIHVHPAYGDVTSFEQLDLYTGVEYRTLKAAHNLKKILRAGVTAMCTPGGNFNINVALRDAVNVGMVEGPRISAGGRYITTYNAIGSAFPSHLGHPASSFAVLCNTRDEMVVEARKQLKDGVDIVKVAGDGDSLTSAGLLAGTISVPDLTAIAEVTHMMAKKCTIHARSGSASRAASEAGFDWVIHGSYMNDDDLGVLEKNRTPINPTLALLANAIEWGPDVGMSARMIDAYKHELDAASAILTKAHRAGLTMLAGTDSGNGPVPYGDWHARELEYLMTYLGMSAMEALLAGTRNAAVALDMDDDIGTLEAGKLADILVVDGDPLTDITVLQDKRRLKLIMKDGALVDTTSRLPEPDVYPWEKPQLYWPVDQVLSQEFVRKKAKNKPAWMTAKPGKSAPGGSNGRTRAA
jgi:imidazolonepropionase-like amidohydrolase